MVYRAYDDHLDRRVALKVLTPELARDELFRARFIQESRIAAATEHPHIIPVFNAGETDGVLYIAMRYVADGDVRTLIDRIGPLPVVRACALIAQVASALDAAHARGLVHRDVKPTNMLLELSRTSRPDHLYLSDFGLAKPSTAATGLHVTGQFFGTVTTWRRSRSRGSRWTAGPTSTPWPAPASRCSAAPRHSSARTGWPSSPRSFPSHHRR